MLYCEIFMTFYSVCNIMTTIFYQQSNNPRDTCKSDGDTEVMFLNSCNYNSKCHIIHETLRICKHHDRYTLPLRSEFRVN